MGSSSSTSRPARSFSGSNSLRRCTAPRRQAAAIVLNAGALTHYGWSLHDALAGALPARSSRCICRNPDAREPWRHTSVLSPVVDGTIAGFGGLGYALAVEAAAALLRRAGDADRSTRS